ncbi:MAG: carbon-nitrogen family hydrolase [Clostridiales bacterium]|nr:carbon-nitrogen family hydrolase [Clostridiales bacterium]
MKTAMLQLLHDDGMTKQQRIDKVCDIISQLDTELVMLPELWNTGFFSFKNYYNNSESIKGPTVRTLLALAKEKNCYICMGSIIEKDGQSFYNTMLLLYPDGKTTVKYRKIHLFGDEARFLKRGNEPVVCDTDFGKVGLSICYDLRFPELYRTLSHQGAQIFLNSSAWPEARVAHWRTLIPARTLENQALGLFCACAGDNHGIRFGGHSIAASSDGTVIGELGDGGEIFSQDLDLEKIMLFRRTFPALGDRVLF